MKKKICLAALLLAFCGLQANATLIETSVGELEITTVNGSFLNLESILTSQLWWGDSDLAIEIAGIVMTDLSEPGQMAPYFAYGVPFIAPDDFIAARWISGFDIVFPIDQERQATDGLTFAVVAPLSIDEPPLFGALCIGLGAIAFARKRLRGDSAG